MIDPELLVTKGLFPENLPPIFTTQQIWLPLSGKTSMTKDTVGELCSYNSSKRGGQRRIFSLPHPFFLKEQAIFFQQHWTDIEALFEYSPGSASKPIIASDNARHIHITPHSELPKIRLKALSRYKFCLITDVSRFYYSIYTHTIPWAINGKAAAKKDFTLHSTIVFGNQLDFIVRQAQSRQTIGIPVGPDSSKIISELIMSAVDKNFIERCGKNYPAYVRHVDDYWIGGHTHEDCERHLNNLRASLKEFELDINENKTKIISTKHIFGDSWPSEFENMLEGSMESSRRQNSQDVLAVLGKIVDRATHDNDEGIIRHVIRVIDRQKKWTANWEILEHFLAQCAVQFPHSLDYVARVVAWRNRIGKPIDTGLWTEIARVATIQHSNVGRDSEVCWAMWLLKELNSKLRKSTTNTVIENSGGLVLAFLAHFAAHKMANDSQLTEKLRDRVEGEPYGGCFWPLTLELTHLGHADPAWAKVTSAAALRLLHDAKVSIIDWNAKPRVFSELDSDHMRSEPDWEPESAIEDFGTDYEEEDEDDFAHLFENL